MTWRMTLRSRLALLVLLAVVPLLLLSLVGAVLSSRTAVTQATENLEFSAALVAANQQRVADSARQVLTVVSNVPGLLEGKEPDCQRYFKALTTELPVYTNIGIVDTEGTIRCHSVPNNPRGFAGDRAWFQAALTSGNFGASGFLVGRVTGNPVIAFALPVKGGEGKVVAVAFAAMFLSEVAKAMTAVEVPRGGKVVIMDRAGIVLATSSPSAGEVGKMVAIAQAGDAIKTGVARVFNATDKTGAEQIYAFRPSSPQPDAPFFVLVSAGQAEILAPARLRLMRNLLSLALIAFFGFWVAWWLTGRFIVKPAADILKATGRIQAGNLTARISVNTRDTDNELTRIASRFNKMADSLLQRDQAQKKSFAELSRTQSQLLAAQKLGRMGYWELDVATNRLVWSPEIHEFFGLQVGEFDGEFDSFLKMIHPNDLARFSKLRDDAVLNGTVLEAEYRIITPAGQVRWIHHVGQEVAAEAGQAVKRNGMVQDITAQQASRAHLLLLQSAVARLNDVVLITEAEPVDQPGPRIVFVNDAFEKQTGYTREEALGQTPRILQGPKTQRSELERIGRALKAWQPVRVELINYTKAGEEYWVDFEIVPIADERGWFTHWVSVQRDITQRKVAEQALIDSEKRYAALFDMAPAAMWVFDAVDFRFLTVNRAAVENYGYSADEFMAMTIFDIRDASEHDALRHQLLRTAPARTAWQHRRKDGSYLTANVVSKPVQYAGRDAKFVVALDITAQVAAEKGVQEQIYMLQRAADAAQAITWHQTLGGTVREAADQARSVIGAHQCVISLALPSAPSRAVSTLSVSSKYAKHRTPDAMPHSTGIYETVDDRKALVRMTQAELQAHPRWLDFRSYADAYPALRGWLAVPLQGRKGQNIGLMHLSDKYKGEFTLQDEYVALELAHLAATAIENARLLEQVTQLNEGLEQKVAERTLALSRQEALFRALAEQAPQVIWTADSDGTTNYFNRAWFDLVGGTREDWIGRKLSSVFHPDDLPEVRENWRHSVSTHAPFVGTRRILGRDGSYHVMSYRALPVFDEQDVVSFWVGIDADVTEIKTIESALRLSNEELEAFSYSVSHDLRAPLNTIDGFSRLLAKQVTGESGVKAQHFISRIQAGVAQMGRLIEDLLALAQVSRAELRLQVVDLSSLSQQILSDWQARDPDRLAVLHIEPGLLTQGDAVLMRVLLENLLSNAWKFTAQRSPAQITVGQQRDAGGLPVFFVRDNGAGFDMAYADKLFVAFQRLHAVSEFPGTGVGLATVSRVISRHGGQLWADAKPGEGATFFFSLPTAAPQAEPDAEKDI